MWLPCSDGNLEMSYESYRVDSESIKPQLIKTRKTRKNNLGDFILTTEILAVRKYGEIFKKPSNFERFKYVS